MKTILTLGALLAMCSVAFAQRPRNPNDYLPGKTDFPALRSHDWIVKPQAASPKFNRTRVEINNSLISIGMDVLLFNSEKIAGSFSPNLRIASRTVVKVEGLPSKRRNSIANRKIYYFGDRKSGIGSECTVYAIEGKTYVLVTIIKRPQNPITDRSVVRQKLTTKDLVAAEDVMLATLNKIRAAKLSTGIPSE